MNTPTQLFANLNTATGTSNAFPSSGDYLSVVASGTFGGGTLTVEVSPDSGSTWVPTSVSLTAPGIANFIGGEGLQFRLSFSGGAAPALNAWVAFQD